MIKWFLGLFGIGKIQSVESIMKPLVKTRKKLQKSQGQNNKAIDENIKRKEALDRANEAHAMQASMAANVIEGLNEQLKPLDALKKPQAAKRG